MALFNTLFVLLFWIKCIISQPLKIIKCMKHKPCTIICNEQYECTNSQINCPINNYCNITCNTYSCHSTIIHANHSSLFDIHIDTNITYQNLTIYLPLNSNINLHTHKFPISNITKDISQMNSFHLILYALNGLKNININTNIQNLIDNHPMSNTNSIIYCTHNYNHHCQFSTATWTCPNTAFPTAIPTISPTQSPTNDPTTQPTENPTYDPTNDPTNDPTAYPSKYPTTTPSEYPSINPTESPTNKPSVTPTKYPSSYPTIPTVNPTMFPTNNPTNISITEYVIFNANKSGKEEGNNLVVPMVVFLCLFIVSLGLCKVFLYTNYISVFDIEIDNTFYAYLVGLRYLCWYRKQQMENNIQILCSRMVFILYKHNKRISDWFHSYCHSFLFIFVSFITFGPYISIPLFNSNVFGISLYSMQISKYDINYTLGKKFFNILTQLLPLFLIRIIYIFWIQTWDIIILSSFIPIMFSFFISSYYLCNARSSKWFHNRYLSKHQLQCFFEVSGPHLSSIRHLGLTKHLQNKFIKLFKINKNQIEIFKPIHCLCQPNQFVNNDIMVVEHRTEE